MRVIGFLFQLIGVFCFADTPCPKALMKAIGQPSSLIQVAEYSELSKAREQLKEYILSQKDELSESLRPEQLKELQEKLDCEKLAHEELMKVFLVISNAMGDASGATLTLAPSENIFAIPLIKDKPASAGELLVAMASLHHPIQLSGVPLRAGGVLRSPKDLVKYYLNSFSNQIKRDLNKIDYPQLDYSAFGMLFPWQEDEIQKIALERRIEMGIAIAKIEAELSKRQAKIALELLLSWTQETVNFKMIRTAYPPDIQVIAKGLREERSEPLKLAAIEYEKLWKKREGSPAWWEILDAIYYIRMQF